MLSLGRLIYTVVSRERRTQLSNDPIFKVFFGYFPSICERVSAYHSLSSRTPFLKPRDVCYYKALDSSTRTTTRTTFIFKFSRLFSKNRHPKTWPWPCGHVCGLQFTFEPREGLPKVSDLRQGFFPQKNRTASRLKVWTSFLHLFAMCLSDFWSRINELFLIFGRLKWCTSTWWKQHGGPKQWTRSSNRCYIPFCRTNKRKYSVPIQS